MHVSRSITFAAAFLLCAISAGASEIPALKTYVTDLASVLAPQDRDRLETFLRDYDTQTGNQFVVLIVPSLEGESLEEFSLAVAEANRIGKKGEDNGLLFLVSINDRKMRFEVGYGLEENLTDALTSVIISDIVAPEFRGGNYAAGIFAGVSAAVKAVSGEFTLAQSPRDERKEKKGGNLFGLIIFLVILFFLMKSNRRRGGGGIWFIGPFGGGGFSGGGGSFGGGGSSGSW